MHSCLQVLPEVMEVEVSAAGEWRPKAGGYPLMAVTDPLGTPLAKPLRSPTQVLLHTPLPPFPSSRDFADQCQWSAPPPLFHLPVFSH